MDVCSIIIYIFFYSYDHYGTLWYILELIIGKTFGFLNFPLTFSFNKMGYKINEDRQFLSFQNGFFQNVSIFILMESIVCIKIHKYIHTKYFLGSYYFDSILLGYYVGIVKSRYWYFWLLSRDRTNSKQSILLANSFWIFTIHDLYLTNWHFKKFRP